MNPERRMLLALAAAVFLPLLLFAALQSAASLRARRLVMETEALTRALQTNAVVDGLLQADLSALDVLASSPLASVRDWRGFKTRVRQVAQSRSRWKSVVLSDIRSRREIWDTRDDLDGTRALRPDIAEYLQHGPPYLNVGGIGQGHSPCPCVALNMPIMQDGAPAYLLTAEIGPEDYQRVLLKYGLLTPGGTSAIVDSRGVFIARTLDPQHKLGTSGSVYVRQAVKRGGHGLYRGVTLEGQDNFTAYETSSVSGWSTHIALRAEQMLSPVRGSLALTLLAGLVAAAFAGVFAAFIIVQFRQREREAARRLQSQKLEAMGQLASGVAHDFGNLLAIVVSALRRVPDDTNDPKVRLAAEQALGAASRGLTLTRQLLNFARTEPIRVERVDLEALLDDLRPLLAQSLGPGITLKIAVEPEARFVRASGALLDLALLNMAVNARDAMPGGGELEVRAAADPSQVGWVKVQVRDTGHGMTGEVLDRLMEPFFTTKPEGKGTGLGAMQILAAVRPSGGAVDVHSEVGVGTTFTLRLPAWSEN